ncbi:MAG: hypothetical protein HKO64_01545 [Xanthomonadales bacterium]|nr:DsrE family protein [Gammaproteobacteria bacterium]NNE05477.1 hypothetical protein [Xanthomonadales bacterium]NNL94283.1 hypothetical protein [Xanthomonadales bacterium]
MNIIIMVNASPWGSSLATTALRFVEAAGSAGHDISAVYFRGDGIYNMLEGPLSDDSLPPMKQAWAELAERRGFKLLLCSSDCARRVPEAVFDNTVASQAGLARWWQLAGESDRMVSF